MKAPSVPENEAARIRALLSYEVLDTAAEPAFDALTRLAAHIANVPIALVSLIDTDRQWFKSRYGLDAPETPRDVSFCGHVVHGGAPMVVADAFTDPRFADNPLVTGEPRVRFYAGVPLRTEEGLVLGTLCAIDHEARELTAEQREMLDLLARQVVDQLELRRRNRTLTKTSAELEKYRRFFDLNLELLATVDDRLFYQDLNPAWERVLGWTCDELRAARLTEFLHPDDVEPTLEQAGRMLREGAPIIDFEFRQRHKDGHYVLLSWVAAVRDGVFHASARDITELRAAQIELRSAVSRAADLNTRLHGILACANYSIIETTPDGIIREFNHAAEQMLGYAGEEVVGKVSPAIIHDGAEVVARAAELSAELGTPVEPGFEAFVAKARRGVADEREWTYIRKDGSRFPVQLSVTARRDELGEIVGYIGIASDISDRKRVARAQAEFVSTVSHELRTPLTSIRGSLGLVAGGVTGELPPEAKEYVDIALSNTDRLVRLINDILDIEKLQSGSMEFRLRATDLASAVSHAMTANGAFASAHSVGLTLTSEVPAGEVLVDPDRLAQVLTNLISNASKFSPAGQSVELSVAHVGSSFRVSVRDHGAGIPEDFRGRIFERFAQADASTTRQKGGTGLGLSISKVIIEKMRGRIGFEGALGGGTTFFFELPYLPPVERRARPAGVAGRLLVCEDDPDVARVLERLLTGSGFTVDVAPTLERARRLLAAHRYDAVTLDLVLADGEGTALIWELRGASATRTIPIFVVSGSDSPLGSAAVMVTDVLVKPFDEARLLSAITHAVAGCASAAPRLLHVEDDDNIRRIVKRTLPEAWTIVTAGSVRTAKEALAREAFDVVILDLSLPDGAGEQLIGLVGRAQVIIFSASDVAVDVSRRVSDALVKSRSNATDLRDAIVLSLARSRAAEPA